ncbi:hypothetical protein [uncultured Umboniibacter sp.]|uniref:hypothetical protein n=1 Tax=uncultured Umboniibacter sp. TaxID=1798917 RepID=UPI002626333D|nr:hypothetical protein [uncultured Umboniibacter sp.]
MKVFNTSFLNRTLFAPTAQSQPRKVSSKVLSKGLLAYRFILALTALSLSIGLLLILMPDLPLTVVLLSALGICSLFIYSLALMAASLFGWEDAQ